MEELEKIVFGFTEEDGYTPEKTKEIGSWGRFYIRIEKFRLAGKMFPLVQHHCWWLFHNCVAHMSIGLIPCRFTFWLHDWTSRKLNAE